MKRIYHHYTLWEDFRAGFYDNCSGEEKKDKINKAIELFSNPELTRDYMMMAIDEWSYSCEHNLSNESMNKIAYIGQAACCLYFGIPSTVTMESWSKVEKEHQDKANEIAKEVLNIWIERNKNIQLCLNII
jgi:hypothetical protein